MTSSTGFGCFDHNYNGGSIEYWLDVHPAFREGPHITANNLWAEWKACHAFGLDPDVYFEKDRMIRAFMVGGLIAHEAIQAMVQFDTREKKKKD